MIGQLPTSLNVHGKEYEIRTDYRDILKILCAYRDEDLTPQEQTYVLLAQTYKDLASIPKEDTEEAYFAAMAFVACEPDPQKVREEKQKKPQIIDWVKDEMMLFPAVNKVAGYEVRAVKYMHWWTFMGLFQNISSDDTYGFVLSIRQKKAKHKKLEKYEQEFFNAHREMVDLHLQTRKDAENELEKWFYEMAAAQDDE